MIGQAFEAIGERPRLPQLNLTRFGDPTGAVVLGDLADDRDKLVVGLPHLAGERHIFGRNELQPFEIVVELAELAECGSECPVIGQQHCR